MNPHRMVRLFAASLCAASLSAAACEMAITPQGKKYLATPIEKRFDRAMAESTAVFIGRVLSVKDYEPNGDYAGTHYLLKVERPFKGDLGNTATALHTISCHYYFEPGSRYLVFAEIDENGFLSVGELDAFPISQKEEKRLLKHVKSNQPLHPTPTAAEAPPSAPGERQR